MLDFRCLNKPHIYRGERQGRGQERQLASDTKPQTSFQGLELPSGACGVDVVQCEIKANNQKRYRHKGPLVLCKGLGSSLTQGWFPTC